jgi:hypothetical protein
MPTPDQIAYVTPTSNFYNDIAINVNAVAYPAKTPKDGHNLLRPSLALRERVPTISAKIAMPSKTHDI